jgi:ABC-type transport system involved in multi-copper enzyme maturation permease subunit
LILAIMLKTYRDARLLLLLLVLAILIFEFMFLFAVGNFAGDAMQMWTRFPFVLRMMSALLGSELSKDISVTAIATLGFAHPFLYATTWAFLITVGTRVLVAEFDRGTADLLMTLPVSRAGLYCALSMVWMLLIVPVSLVPWLGITLGELRFPLEEPLNHARLGMVVLNLMALNVCIGCIAMWVSSFMIRRGPAVAIVLGVLLYSFVWNFLVALVPWMREITLPMMDRKLDLGIFGLLNFYRPLEIVRMGAFPRIDILTLLAIAAIAWSAGLVHFRRRDIPAA